MANFFYAMAVWRKVPQMTGESAQQTLQQVEALLTKAVNLDSGCADGYLQLGILYASRPDLPKAVDEYRKALEANPRLSDAHYRLGVAYDRMGEPGKANLEFQRHDAIEKEQLAAIESQRKEIKQFLVVLDKQR